MNRLNLVKRLKPKSVILSIGSNDLVLLNHTPETIVKHIISIKNQLESELKTKVYVFSMTPVLRDHHISNMDYIDSRTNQELEEINNLLKQQIKQEEFFNVYEDLIDENNHLNLRYTTDGIHLNKEGYEYYIKYIKSVL
jgi:lysophospholipase L1-like esterase